MKRFLLFLFALAIAAPQANASENDQPPLLDPGAYGRLHRAVTTKSAAAQRWFDQGLALVYSFDHDNAIRSFEQALQADPECAMAWWGIAHACGMHINLPIITPSRAAQAWKSISRARALAAAGTPVEQALIEAQAKRFAENLPENHRPHDEAYAAAMQEVWRRFPADPDVGALCAEAMMNLRPWDLWQADGSPQPGTLEILGTLDRVLALEPNHAQGLHLYIHVVEASPDPAKSVPMADRLRLLQPALGHMVHMPSHSDVLNGRWAESIEANARAVEADRVTRGRFGTPPGFLWLYMGHNRHMLAFGAMMSGRRALAERHINDLMAELPLETAWGKDWGFVADYFAPMPFEITARFGRWDQLLALPEPPENMRLGRAIRHALRAVALATKGDFAAARASLEAFGAARGAVAPDAYAGNNPATAILDLAGTMATGEVLVLEGKREEGIARLREATKLEDALRYDEPPDWVIPVRHSLGAALVNSGRFREAEQVYREDLRKWPENGWSLFGLARVLQRLGRAEEAKAVMERFRRTWAQGDTDLNSSCLCQPFVGS